VTPGRMPTAIACAMAAASLLLYAAGCTDVVNAGTVIRAQTVDAGDTSPPADGSRTLEEICTSTGGHVEVRGCCGNNDFAPLCWNDSCCGLAAPGGVMKDVRLCICPQRLCFSPTPPLPGFNAGCNYQEMSSPRSDGATDGAARDEG
jgi:hypothetical protein